MHGAMGDACEEAGALADLGRPITGGVVAGGIRSACERLGLFGKADG